MPYYVYILTNKSNTLYVGSTKNLQQRLKQHTRKYVAGFTSKYNINKLVYFQELDSFVAAQIIEKKLKGWTRRKKIELIKTINPEFTDLLKGI